LEDRSIAAQKMALANTDFTDETFGVYENASPADVLDQVLNHGLRHVVQRSGVTPGHEMETARRMLNDPQSYFKFPVSTIFNAVQNTVESEALLRALVMEFSTPREKEDVLQLLRSYLQPQVGVGLLSDVLLIADELFTNAVFNAPFENWNQEVGGISRNSEKLRDLKVKTAQLIVARDEKRIVICCVDEYGALNPLKLIERLNRVLNEGLGSALNYGPGGAGIGTSMIYGACSSLYLGVQKGQRTVVSVSLPLLASRKAREQTPKNVHIVMMDSGQKIRG
jgi:hypothetical protein